jgi:WD40 repeat protein
VNTINFDPGGDLLVSGSDDRSVVVWDVEHRRPLISLRYVHLCSPVPSECLPEWTVMREWV